MWVNCSCIWQAFGGVESLRYVNTYLSYEVVREKFMTSKEIFCFCKRGNVMKLRYHIYSLLPMDDIALFRALGCQRVGEAFFSSFEDISGRGGC